MTPKPLTTPQRLRVFAIIADPDRVKRKPKEGKP